MRKVALDTNVFVSSLLVRRGLPAQVLDAWRERQYLLIISPAIVSEIQSTLSYPRIRRKYATDHEDVAQLINLLERDALAVPGDAETAGAVPQDPTDEPVVSAAEPAALACAVEAGADLIVSGDRHLLDLSAYQGIPILTVRAFLARLESTP
jgi:putative PIN family toxin of toxin-antitoxin system